jgi:hypothetical protein
MLTGPIQDIGMLQHRKNECQEQPDCRRCDGAIYLDRGAEQSNLRLSPTQARVHNRAKSLSAKYVICSHSTRTRSQRYSKRFHRSPDHPRGPPRGPSHCTRDHVSSPTSRRGQHGAHAARDERFPRHWAPAARGRMMLDPQSGLRMRPGLQLRLLG